MNDNNLPSKEVLQEKVLEISHKISDAIQDLTEVSSLLNCVPLVGPYVYAVATADSTRRTNERLNLTIHFLKEKLRGIDESKVDMEFLKSELFYDLVHKLFEKSARTRHKEKIELYTDILRGTIENSTNIIKYQPEEYLNSLADLNIKEINILFSFYQKEKKLPQPIQTFYKSIKDKSSNQIRKDNPNVYKDLLNYNNYKEELKTKNKFSLKRISSNGFLDEIYIPVHGGLIIDYIISDEANNMFELIKITSNNKD